MIHCKRRSLIKRATTTIFSWQSGTRFDCTSGVYVHVAHVHKVRPRPKSNIIEDLPGSHVMPVSWPHRRSSLGASSMQTEVGHKLVIGSPFLLFLLLALSCAAATTAAAGRRSLLLLLLQLLLLHLILLLAVVIVRADRLLPGRLCKPTHRRFRQQAIEVRPTSIVQGSVVCQHKALDGKWNPVMKASEWTLNPSK